MLFSPPPSFSYNGQNTDMCSSPPFLSSFRKCYMHAICWTSLFFFPLSVSIPSLFTPPCYAVCHGRVKVLMSVFEIAVSVSEKNHNSGDLSEATLLVSLSWLPPFSNIRNLEPTSRLSSPSHLLSSTWQIGQK
jgi:hypothetical protein